MYRVIIERPRLCFDRGTDHRRAQRLRDDPESEPRFEPIRMKSKFLNENLAPLDRFLRSRVGRPWNEVHSEICAHIALRSAVQKHVLDHLRHMVYLRVEMVDGQPCDVISRYRRGPIATPKGELYVCPETGILRLARCRKVRRKRRG